MFEVPDWIVNFVNKDGFRCSSCTLGFQDGGVSGLGIKRAHSEPDRNVLFIEYSCPRCEQKMMMELRDMDLLEFVTGIIDGLEDKQMEAKIKDEGKKVKKHTGKNGQKKAKKRTGRSKITKDEYQRAVDMLNDCEYWVDWLSVIGADGSVQEEGFMESFRLQKNEDGDEDEGES